MDKALKYILQTLAAAKAAGRLPDSISLTTYQDDAALRRFRPAENWPGGAAEHERAMLNIAARVTAAYPTVKVNLRQINTAAYDEWLKSHGLIDSESNRATFALEEGEDE